MDCLEFRKNLLLHVGRELPDEREREIRVHLESCPCCQRRARYEERFQSALREHLAPPPLPPGLRERICQRLATEARSGPTLGRRSLLLRQGPVSAFGLLLVLSVVVAWWLLPWRGSQGAAPAVRLEGRLVCLRCERNGFAPALHHPGPVSDHPTGLRTLDGRVLALAGEGAATLQGDSALLGRKVEVEGALDPRTGTLEVLRHTFTDGERLPGRAGAPGALPRPVL